VTCAHARVAISNNQPYWCLGAHYIEMQHDGHNQKSSSTTCNESLSRFVLTSANSSRMIQYGVFEVPEINFPKGGESDAKSIRLHLSQIDRLEPDGYPISGTFRSTVEEPDLSGEKDVYPSA
jgi:hypothetical protein